MELQRTKEPTEPRPVLDGSGEGEPPITLFQRWEEWRAYDIERSEGRLIFWALWLLLGMFTSVMAISSNEATGFAFILLGMVYGLVWLPARWAGGVHKFIQSSDPAIFLSEWDGTANANRSTGRPLWQIVLEERAPRLVITQLLVLAMLVAYLFQPIAWILILLAMGILSLVIYRIAMDWITENVPDEFSAIEPTGSLPSVEAFTAWRKIKLHWDRLLSLRMVFFTSGAAAALLFTIFTFEALHWGYGIAVAIASLILLSRLLYCIITDERSPNKRRFTDFLQVWEEAGGEVAA